MEHAKLKLLIVEDSVEMQERLCLLLQREYDLVAVVANGLEVCGAVESLHPDLITLDISLPGLNGIEVARRLLKIGALAKVVFVSQQQQLVYVDEARQVGAAGYVFKDRIRTDLLPALKAAFEMEPPRVSS